MNVKQRITELRAELAQLEAVPTPRHGDTVRFDVDNSLRIVIVDANGTVSAYGSDGYRSAEGEGVDRLYEDGYVVIGNAFNQLEAKQ